MSRVSILLPSGCAGHAPGSTAPSESSSTGRSLRGRGGSVSAWEDEAALRSFVSLPFHVEIMRRYRGRGSLRAFDWEAESFDLGAAFAEGQRALDEGKGRQR